ncbi:hypothetical protein [Paracoccus caeni]|nr:hypothetical protein [Paracoccus caeni]
MAFGGLRGRPDHPNGFALSIPQTGDVAITSSKRQAGIRPG